MSSKNIVAIGGGGFGRALGSLEIEKYIISLVGKKRPIEEQEYVEPITIVFNIIPCRVQKYRLVWPSPAPSQAKLKEHLGRNAAGTFPSHCDSLGLRNENPPSLLNRTTLGAAYSPARREIYLASRSCLAPSRLYYLLVSSALCSPWFSPEKAYRQYMR